MSKPRELKALVLANALLWSTAGCTATCTASYLDGLVVRLVDARTGARVCDATVTATDGAYRETLAQSPAFLLDASTDCFFAGAGERAGTYTIGAKAGDSEKTVTDVVVTHDDCHVIPRSLTIAL